MFSALLPDCLPFRACRRNTEQPLAFLRPHSPMPFQGQAAHGRPNGNPSSARYIV
ncbi:hypothetical protein B0H67DRAFT_158762 [Lasiosphaeris hirsuta]|uniref:Uncharacterized protein n=1 Tax=Lasiosphaeris hirsuta TaxID=260670 RepID=A0AA40API7_9PEZI|nr:hypothetical protein B0H67DRAFT_158762 [Lasiosphaeris hirsuta]